MKGIMLNSQISDKSNKSGQRHECTRKNRISKTQMKMVNASIASKDTTMNMIGGTGLVVSSGRVNSSMKKNGNKENIKSNSDQVLMKNGTSPSSSTFSTVRGVNSCVANVLHDSSTKSKGYNSKKFNQDVDGKIKNYQVQSRIKEVTNNQDCKTKHDSSVASLPLRITNHSGTTSLRRENHPTTSVPHCSHSASHNGNSMLTLAKKALDQQNSLAKMTPNNFPPLRAPQSIVNVRHPFVTEARTKQTEINSASAKSKTTSSNLHNIAKKINHIRQTVHNYGTSQMTGMPSMSNVTASISPYPRPESFPQPTVANVMFPDTSQYPQSPSFGTTQISQLNQYHQTYDPSNYATTPVSVNPVIPQFSAESSIAYPQYENPPQFVQPSHYPTAEITNSQYRYQTAGVGQIQDSPMYIQSLQSPIAVADQYATPNYARAVRTELLPRLRRPPRFNK